MLEVLLMQYEDIFGEAFPLEDFMDKSEISLINILYECVQTNTPYDSEMKPSGNIKGPSSK
ncbi:MAG: hypothetical protein KBS68_01625 [Clostridiales bacterium]|nr:hypothetical protein [Candidatus Crickella merdequi]